MGRILIVDDERSLRVTLKAFLEQESHLVDTAENGAAAIEILQNTPVDVILADIIMPKLSGVDLLKKAKDISPDALVIMMTGRPTLENATESLRHGALDYLQKPVSKVDVTRAVRNALHIKFINDERARLERENRNYMNHLEQMVAERTKKLSENEIALKHRAEELDKKATQLEKANLALSAVLEHREAEKRAIEASLILNIKKYVLPTIEDMARCRIDSRASGYLTAVKTKLNEIMSSSSRSLFVKYQNLTPTEVRVADFLRQGLSTKAIADVLNISPGSVSFHRNSIRRKLGLVDKKVNLKSFLNSLS
jgi:DNA-binding NarL/FixJ family response regulator